MTRFICLFIHRLVDQRVRGTAPRGPCVRGRSAVGALAGICAGAAVPLVAELAGICWPGDGRTLTLRRSGRLRDRVGGAWPFTSARRRALVPVRTATSTVASS